MFPKALKSWPKSNKSPDLVTLVVGLIFHQAPTYFWHYSLLPYLTDQKSQCKGHCSSQSSVAQNKLVYKTELMDSVSVGNDRLKQDSDGAIKEAEYDG